MTAPTAERRAEGAAAAWRDGAAAVAISMALRVDTRHSVDDCGSCTRLECRFNSTEVVVDLVGESCSVVRLAVCSAQGHGPAVDFGPSAPLQLLPPSV